MLVTCCMTHANPFPCLRIKGSSGSRSRLFAFCRKTPLFNPLRCESHCLDRGRYTQPMPPLFSVPSSHYQTIGEWQASRAGLAIVLHPVWLIVWREAVVGGHPEVEQLGTVASKSGFALHAPKKVRSTDHIPLLPPTQCDPVVSKDNL